MTASARPPRSFLVGVLAVTALGLGIRLLNVGVWRPTCDEPLIEIAQEGRSDELVDQPEGCFAVRGDALYAHIQGYWNGKGEWYVDAADFLVDDGDLSQPGAQDLPLYALVLGGVTAMGGESPAAHRVVSAFIGAAGVVAIALAGRRVAGARAGLLAGALAAVHPLLWINDGMLMGETLLAPLVGAAVLVLYRFWDEPGWRSAVVVGLVVGLTALTRGEAVLLLGLALVPLLVGLVRTEVLRPGRAAALAATATGVAGLLLLPWVGWNLVRFEHPVTLTSGTGAVLSAGSCDPEFYGEFLGFWGNCYDLHVAEGLVEGPPPGTVDESVLDQAKREGATAYLSEHLDRLPVVVAARVGRVWDLYRPDQMAWLNATLEGRGKWASDAGVRLHLLFFLPAGVAGTVVLWRRRIPVSPLVSLAVAVTLTAAISFGLTRYRVPADVALVIAAAVALDALARRWWPVSDGGWVTPKGRRSIPAAVDAAEPVPT